jgi:hypothetical protein
MRHMWRRPRSMASTMSAAMLQHAPQRGGCISHTWQHVTRCVGQGGQQQQQPPPLPQGIPRSSAHATCPADARPASGDVPASLTSAERGKGMAWRTADVALLRSCPGAARSGSSEGLFTYGLLDDIFAGIRRAGGEATWISGVTDTLIFRSDRKQQRGHFTRGFDLGLVGS